MTHRFHTPFAFVLVAGFLSGCGTSVPSTSAPRTAADVDYYGTPPLDVSQLTLAEGEAGNPRQLRVFVPTRAGKYPLLQFQHGFISSIDNYTDLLARLAGFGFVVVSPQMYGNNPSTAPSIPDETTAAVQVLAWAQGSLDEVLSSRGFAARADTARTGLLGHSRGGQVAWRMLFDHPDETQARAIAGVDPVDGDAPPFPPGQTGELVTDDPGAFHFSFPSLIIGTGLGGTGAPGFECAPKNRNYTLFYDASQPPRYEVVASDYGHNDMSNGDTPDPVCPGSVDGTRNLMRVFTGGQLAAYFTAVLDHRERDLDWLRDLSNAPIATTGRYED